VTNNGGDANLVVSGVVVGGANSADFSAESGCTAPVALGGSCPIAVRFSPSAAGGRVANLTVNSNAAAPLSILMTGTGLAATGPPSPTGPRTLSTLRIGPARFRAVKGTTVSYTASAPGTTTLTVLKSAPGRRIGTRCRALPTKPAKGVTIRRCTRTTTVGSLTHTDTAGQNTVTFNGKLKGRALRPGRYTMRVTPAPGAKALTGSFTVTP
jgi:hypothetical protein